MKKDQHTDCDFEMRQRFAEQTTRFWQASKQKNVGDTLCTEDTRTDVLLQDDPYKRPLTSGRQVPSFMKEKATAR
jgi:hypothetical protein